MSWEDPLQEGMATPVFLSGEFHGQRSLVGYSPWGCKESDTTEVTEHVSTHKQELQPPNNKTLESPLGLQGDQPWDFFARNDAKAETPVLWPPHAKS